MIARDFGAGDTNAPVFRSAEGASRAPQPEGSIVSTDNFLMTVNLGSLDGLAKGTRLDVLRGGQRIGELEITTVFRDRARGRVVTQQAVQVNDRVRTAASVYLGAVVEQMNADPANARKIGRDALSWAGTNSVPLAETRALLERIAPLDYQSGDLVVAEQDYQSLLSTAANLAEKAAALNNLGAISELRGDRSAAEARYKDALRALADSSSAAHDRQIIEANLVRVAGGHEKR